MKEIFGFISSFFKEINKPVLISCTFLIAFLIFLNFYFKLDHYTESQNSLLTTFFSRYLIFLLAFSLPYCFYFLWQDKNYFRSTLLSFLVVISPAIFSWKMTIPVEIYFSDDINENYYWNQVCYWPLRLVMMAALLWIVRWIFYAKESFFGLTIKNFKWRPYLLMLIIMLPLIALASTQQDFLSMYPKMKQIHSSVAGIENNLPYKLLYELAYGTDFISVELFFRGFLILAFVNIAGKDAILPMACFYCTIHFGKPLGECISSYLGGILLGVIVYHTRSVLGGLVVHLGIAWLMELGGAIGNALNKF